MPSNQFDLHLTLLEMSWSLNFLRLMIGNNFYVLCCLGRCDVTPLHIVGTISFEVEEVGIWSMDFPVIDMFLYSHHLSLWYCVVIIGRNTVLVTLGSLRECLCKSGPVDFAWDTDFARFSCVLRHSCTYTKTTISLIGSLYFSEFYGN